MRTRTGLLTALVVAAVAPPASAATLVVAPGGSIQTAIDKSHAGDTVKVLAGTYVEKGRSCPTDATKRCAVVIRKDGIRLIGQPTPGHPVVLASNGKQFQGVAVSRAAGGKACLTDRARRIHGSRVEGVLVQGFAHDGVFLYCVDGWRITRVRATGNDEYGIFPSHSGKGRVDRSFASGANDTGIYIGQSHDVEIDHNTATGNVSGFEIENSRRVRAHHNTAFGNTAGILSFALPGLDVKRNVGNRIDHNVVRANDRANTCSDPEDTVCNVPPGSGILLVAAHRNTVEYNEVRSNRTVGIAVVNYCIVTGTPSTTCTNDIDPNSVDDHVLQNVALGNAGNPAHPYETIASDLVWDTTGTGNCWALNRYATSFPGSLPQCPP
jgi:parallel beta-helix repeat protein